MFNKRRFIHFTIIVAIVSFMSICTIAAIKIEDNYNTSIGYEIPIFNILVLENA